MSVREKRNGKYRNMLEQGDVYPGSYQVGPTFNGPTSDAGIRIKAIEGKSVQAVSHGYQLFDQSKIATATIQGASLCNNGDGSFTFDTSDMESTSFLSFFTYRMSHLDMVKHFKPGQVFGSGMTSEDCYMEVGIIDASHSWISANTKRLCPKSGSTLTITQEDLDNKSYAMLFWFLTRKASSQITLKPMIYQDGDGTYEPYTGGKPGPQPEYPIPIISYLVNKFASNFDRVPLATKSPFHLRSLPDGTCDEYKDGKVIRRVGVVTLDGSSDEPWTISDMVNGYTRALFIEPNGEKLLLDLTGNTRCNRFPVTGKVAGGNSTWPNPDHECLCAVSSNTPGNTGLIIEGEYTNAQLRAWLQTHPLDVYYKLAEPTIEDAPALPPILPSSVPRTEAWSDSSLRPTITWEALPAGSCALEVQELRKRIEELESEVLNSA